MILVTFRFPYSQFLSPTMSSRHYHIITAVASLGLVSPGAATDGVTLFFLEKKLTTFYNLWKLMTFYSCRLLTTPIFSRRLFSVLSKSHHKKK